MRTHDLWGNAPATATDSRYVCSIDPISAGMVALGGLAGSLFGGGGGGGSSQAQASTPAPQTPAPQQVAAPTPKSPMPKQNQGSASTFIGSVPTPPPSTGQKTLLGQ